MGDRIKPNAAAASRTSKGEAANVSDHQPHPAAPRVDDMGEHAALPTQRRRAPDTKSAEP